MYLCLSLLCLLLLFCLISMKTIQTLEIQTGWFFTYLVDFVFSKFPLQRWDRKTLLSSADIHIHPLEVKQGDIRELRKGNSMKELLTTKLQLGTCIRKITLFRCKRISRFWIMDVHNTSKSCRVIYMKCISMKCMLMSFLTWSGSFWYILCLNHYRVPLSDLFLVCCLLILHDFQYEFVDRILSYWNDFDFPLCLFISASQIKLII